MNADSPDPAYPAPFDSANFIVPAEWHTFSDLLGGAETSLLLMREGIIIHVNAPLAERLGYSPEELIGKPVETLYPPEKELPAHGVGTAPASGEMSTVRLLSRAGTPVTFHFIANRIDTLTDARYTIWVLHPDHHDAARSLDDVLRMQALADHLPDLLVLCAPDGTLAYANHAFEDLTGRGVGMLADLAHPGDRAQLQGAMESAGADDMATVPVAFRLRHVDGGWRHVSGQVRNLLAQPNVESLMFILRDVTAEVQMHTSAKAEKKRQLHYLNRLLRQSLRPRADLDAALKSILKGTAKALGITRCIYWEMSEDPDATRCQMAYDDHTQHYSAGRPGGLFASVFHPFLMQVLAGKRPVEVADVDRDPRTALLCEYLHLESIKAMVLVPVWRDGRVPGLLMLASVGQAHAWRKDEVEFSASVADLIAQSFEDVDRRRTEAQLRHLAHHDNLTGLPNRHFLFDQAEEIFPKVTAKANTLAAFFIDLDGFKNVNDTLGHAVGDELLKAAALRLKNVVRKDDILVRLGGDEFMLLARNINNMRIADDIAAQIIETMRGTFSLQARELKISASVGIALYPFDGTDIETLMKKADIAMYHAKASGRDQYQMFAPRLDDGASQRSALEGELRRAIAERELQHFYKPQVDLRTGKVRCVEALLRWHHPRLGVLLPASFLPVAEESGLIHDISKWVLEDACNQLRSWTAQGLDHLNIAINLSSSQLMDRSLWTELESALDRSGISGSRLEWEVKESTVMQHHTMSSSMLDRVADMQIGLSIDDFGTGYSNMAYLRRYPVRKVKIDSSFVNGLPAEGDDRAITEAIISMAMPLGLDVVAEGVETPEQMDYLREHGCHIAQGYFFTQPLSAEQFEKWLVRH